jgi:hypothetical protein
MIGDLESARLKLTRASEHIEAVKASIAAYGSAGNAFEIVPAKDGNDKLKIVSDPPAHISILCGEVVYQIRSALDHLAFSLVKVNSANVPADWEEHCAFPLKLSLPKTVQNAPVPYGHDSFSRSLPGIPKEAFAFVESVQPYYGSSRFCSRFLTMLEKLSNIDKHRHLNLTVTRVRINELVSFETGKAQGAWSIRSDSEVLESAVRADSSMGRAVGVERSLAPIITFDESALSDSATMPVEVVLQYCAYTVETLIVPKFEQFISGTW